MAQTFTAGRFKSFLDSGSPNAGGRLYTYNSGTTTFKTAYTDATLATPCTYTSDGIGGQYIALNARGEAQVWLGSGTYTFVVQDNLGATIWSIDGQADQGSYATSYVLGRLTNSSDATQGSGLPNFNFQLNYAANTIGWAVKNALGANPLWFGAAGDGIQDDTTFVQAAMNFSKTVTIPGGKVFLCKSGLSMNQAQQVILGNGLGSEIRFALTSLGVGLTTSNAAGQQQIMGVLLNGQSNVTKTISVGSPQLTIANSYVYNSTATGHCVYQEDENVGSNRYVFGLTLQNVIIQGPGPGATLPTWTNVNTYGLRTGTNSQTTRVVGGAITNCSTLIWINGATSEFSIQGTTLENCADTEQAILIDRPGSGMPCYGISINAYFEQAHQCIVVGDCDPSGLTIRGCLASRNTLSPKATSYFYRASGGTAASTQNISIDYNYHSDYGVFLGLGNEYGARIVSAIGNTTSTSTPTTTYSSGTFSNNAYEIKACSASFGYVIEAGGVGAVVSNSAQRIEVKSGTVTVLAPLKTRDKLAKIEFYTIPNGGNSVTVNLIEMPLTSAGSPTTIGTATSTTQNTYSLSVPDGYAIKDGYCYLLQIVANSVGTSSYVYPFKIYLYR